MDSNEDGFTENDVRAICSIHQSSKKQTGGYIGHKGIGFKSVFKVAYKVSIQSGPFSFYFEHHQGDSGLGMITPFNEEPQELPPSVNTRITLFFISISDFEARASELREIPDTMLLFLRKLQRLTVNIPSLQSQISFTRFEDKSKHLITLTKETNGEQVTKFYHLEKTTLSNLPQHLSRPGQPEVDLILAFPVQEDYSPLIQAHFSSNRTLSHKPVDKESIVAIETMLFARVLAICFSKLSPISVSIRRLDTNGYSIFRGRTFAIPSGPIFER